MLEFLKSLFLRLERGAEVIPDAPGGPVVAVREGYRVQKLEVGTPAAPPRRHIFGDMASFSGWLLKHAKAADCEILGSQSPNGAAVTALCGNRWGADQVVCRPGLHPAFVLLSGLHKQGRQQTDLYAAIREIAAYIPEAPALLSELASLTIGGSGKITCAVDPRTGAAKLSSMEKDVSYPVNLRAEFTVNLPIWIGAAPVAVVVGIMPALVQDKLVLTCSIRELDLVLSGAWEAEMVRLKAMLGEEWLVGCGSIA